MSGLLSRLPTKARNFIDKHILGHAGPAAGGAGTAGNPPPVQPPIQVVQPPPQTPWTAARPMAQPLPQPPPQSQPPNRPPPLTPPEQLKAKQDYEAARNPLATDEGKVQQLPDQPNSLKLLRDAYTALSEEIKTLTDAGDYVEALKKVPGLKTSVEDALAASDKQGQDKLAYEAERGTFSADEGKVKLMPDLPASLKTLREACTTLSEEIKIFTDAGDYTEALKKLPALKQAVADAIAKSDKLAQDKLTYETERGKLTADEGKVKLIPDLPDSLKLLREAYTTLSDAIELLTNAGKYDEALLKLPDLKLAVEKAITAADKQAQDKLTYETERGKLTADEGKVQLIPDTPDYLKNLRVAYTTLSGEIKALTDAENYEEAAKKLASLKSAIADALTGVGRNKNEDDSKLKCDTATNALNKMTPNGKKAYDDPPSEDWKKAVDAVLEMKVDDEFTAAYDKTCKEVADDLINNPKVKEAFAKWSEWAASPDSILANKDKMDELMKEVIKVQSARLGIDPPTPVETFEEPSRPGLYGGFNSGTGKIRINLSNSSIDDFREVLDTLTHENTHAYQAKLIKAKKAGTLKPGDAEYNAAQIFEVNTGTGYIGSAKSAHYPGKQAYDKQPKEVHAWRAGEKTGRATYDALQSGG